MSIGTNLISNSSIFDSFIINSYSILKNKKLMRNEYLNSEKKKKEIKISK